MKRCNSINGQFAARRTVVRGSSAYRTLSLSGQTIISRTEIEFSHDGSDNGLHPATIEGFVHYGIRRVHRIQTLQEANPIACTTRANEQAKCV